MTVAQSTETQTETDTETETETETNTVTQKTPTTTVGRQTTSEPAAVDVSECVATTSTERRGWREASAPCGLAIGAGPMVAISQGLLVWGGELISETEWTGAGGILTTITGAWRAVAASPLPPMSGHAMVDTGAGVFICCGRNETGWQALGAIYDPVADEWTGTAPPPAGETRVTPVWTGEEILLPQRSARYDLISDHWSTLSPPPATIVAAAEAFWTGRELIVWNNQFRGGDILSYDPEADQWERLPRLPSEAPVWGGRMVWTGTDLIVWGDQQTDNGQAVGWAFNLDDRAWRRIAPAPGDPGSWSEGTPGSNSAVWTGSHMLVWAGDLRVAPDETTAVLSYDPSTDTWERLPDAPSRWYGPSLVWDGDQLIVGSDPILTYGQ